MRLFRTPIYKLAFMQKRPLLISVTTTLVALASAAVFAFLSSLSPSERARANAELAIPLKDIPTGAVLQFDMGGRPLFVLRPSEEQWASIRMLDAHVRDSEIRSFFEPSGVFVYWGSSSRRGCPLEHVPPGPSRLLDLSPSARWLGGYWDPICEMSYDYAGRAIATWEYSGNGFVSPYENLASPSVKFFRDSLVISAL